MRILTKPSELIEIENGIDLMSAINTVTSLDEPEGISELKELKEKWIRELTNYNYEMEQNKFLSHNNRVNFSKFKEQLEWIYNHPSKKRKTIFINQLRDAYINNGIQCPYCGVSPCRTLDHYYNKALLPQFSFLPENLIPCCGDCNKDKGSKKAFNKWKRIINPYYDDYSTLLNLEPLLVIIFRENPVLNVDMNYIVTPNNKLNKKVRRHINYHLKAIKINLLHQEMICNSFWRNARCLREYKGLLVNGDLPRDTYDILIRNFIRKNPKINYDWEYIVRYSLVHITANHWIYDSNLDKLQ